jgi:DNA-binding SARP family transcriptional activator
MTSTATSATVSLSLLGAFEFRVRGVQVDLPRATERLVAFLALQRRPVTRHRAAGMLWPDVSEDRSLGSLRSALWRLRKAASDVVDLRESTMRLDPAARIDIDTLADCSRELSDRADIDIAAIDTSLFGAELLPGWYDEWVLYERERLRQVSLHALEALSRCHVAAGRHGEAVEAAWRAITLEPLRESAHDALIDAHLAEGNICEAVRRYRAFAALLRDEVGVGPSGTLTTRVVSAIEGRGGSPAGISSVR